MYSSSLIISFVHSPNLFSVPTGEKDASRLVVGVAESDCEKYINSYLNQYPELAKYAGKKKSSTTSIFCGRNLCYYASTSIHTSSTPNATPMERTPAPRLCSALIAILMHVEM